VFAAKRQEARVFLTHDPESPVQRYDIGDTLRLLREDSHACLRVHGWTNEAIAELEERDRIARRAQSR
jgi:hypothetical protein